MRTKEQLNDSEKFVYSIGKFIERTDPKLLELDLESDKVPTKKLVSLGSKIMGAIISGDDSMSFDQVEFTALFRAFKSLRDEVQE